MKKVINLIITLFTVVSTLFAQNEKPVVFKFPDSNEPGNVVLFTGGSLNKTDKILVWKLPDGVIETPNAIKKTEAISTAILQQALQPVEGSVKFKIPATFKKGVYAAQIMTGNQKGPTIILNRPELWFLQPIRLEPGLNENQAVAGNEIQIIGKNFLLPGDKGSPSIALRLENTKTWQVIKALRAERFSMWVKLPSVLKNGRYELKAHNGFGGVAGWGDPLTFEIKNRDIWPDNVFNVKDFGAQGNDINDDTKAITAALTAAGKNGGGVVYFPWGTYRLTHWIGIPQKTTLKGDQRDGTILKWPVDEPKTLNDFTPSAIFGTAPFAIEDLTIIVRKVDCAITEISTGRDIPKELLPKMKPWGQTRDIFLRNLNVQHWLMCGHPDNNSELWLKKYAGDGAYNWRNGNIHNFEVSNCIFQGGHNYFKDTKNSRITDNSFSNSMGYNWTVLGGGTHYEVCTGNEIRASSSFGYGSIGMKYVYSAHNKSYNFVKGEREAMTLDISALPTERPVTQYWGAPVEVSNKPDNVFLRFSKPDLINTDGFKTGFTSDCFKGGIAYIRAYNGGAGEKQSRKIIGNNETTIFLEKPWDIVPDIEPHKLYIEIQPRNGGTAAWFGNPVSMKTLSLTFKNTASWVPDEFKTMTAVILDGKGAGQYREIVKNSQNEITIDRPWDVEPDTTCAIGIWSLMRHMIVYKSEGYDCSAFAQLWGSYYDYTIDECHVERNQGIWAQSGWFVNFRYNDLLYGNSYHPGIGPHGNNMEKNLSFSFIGMISGDLRVTKFRPLQYSETSKTVMVDPLFGRPIPGGRGVYVKGNKLLYNQRVAFTPSDNAIQQDKGIVRFVDLIIDNNTIEKSNVGIQVGPQAVGVVTNDNKFIDVTQPFLISKPKNVLSLENFGR